VVDHGGIALTDARGLDDHHVGPPRPRRGDHVVDRIGQHGAGGTGGEAAEVDPRRVDRVHADAVAEQGAAAAAAGRIDRQHRDGDLVLEVEPEASDQLVGQRRLARSAGARDAQHRCPATLGRSPDLVPVGGGQRPGLEHGDRAGQGALVAAEQGVDRGGAPGGEVDVAVAHQQVDHGGEPELLAVVGREDPAHAVGLEVLDLGGEDRAAPAAEHLDLSGAALAEQVDQVGEELDVPALVGADRHALHVLLQGSGDDLVDRAVVAEVDHLDALRLEDPPHDVDRRVVAVEQARRGDEAHRVDGLVDVGFHRSRFDRM